MAKIIWLASYPKSGNTWVRAFLTAYFYGRVNINTMADTQSAAGRDIIDRFSGVRSATLAPPQAHSLRPEVYRRLAAAPARNGLPALLKVHDLYQATIMGEPMFPAEATHATVYIVRHPLDAAVSFAHHLGFTMEQIANTICHETFTLGLRGPSTRLQLPQRIASWRTHVASWLDQTALPIILVKYEDLVAKPTETFTAMLKAMGFAVPGATDLAGTEDEKLRAHIEAAVKATSFAALQAQELVGRFREKSRRARDSSFFRKGKVGGWQEEMPATIAKKISDYNAPMMLRLGYQTL